MIARRTRPLLDRLEANALVRRERDRQDLRFVQVTLTPSREALVANAPSPLQDMLAHAMINQSEAEQATIARSLERIVEMMEGRHIDAAPILETGPIEPAAKDTEPERQQGKR